MKLLRQLIFAAILTYNVDKWHKDGHKFYFYPPGPLQGSISSTYLHTAFTPIAPQSLRTQSNCQYLFMLLGSVHIKAVRRMLMKLSPVSKVCHDFVGQIKFKAKHYALADFIVLYTKRRVKLTPDKNYFFFW